MKSLKKYLNPAAFPAPNKSYQEVRFRANLDCCSACSNKVNQYLEKQTDVDEYYTQREQKSIYVKGNVDAEKMAKKLSNLLCKKVEIESAKPVELLTAPIHSSSRASNATAAGNNSTRNDTSRTHQQASAGGFESHQRESMSSTRRSHRVGARASAGEESDHDSLIRKNSRMARNGTAAASRSHTRGVLNNNHGGSAAGAGHGHGGGSGGNVTYLGDFGGASNNNGGGVGGGGSNHGSGSRNYGGGARSNYGAFSGGGVSNHCGNGRGGGNNCGSGSGRGFSNNYCSRGGGGRNCGGGRGGGRCGRGWIEFRWT